MAAAWEKRLIDVCVSTGTTEALPRLRQLVLGLLDDPNAPTAFKTATAIVDGHIADSLAGLDAIPDRATVARIVDLGSGAGFPGLALAAVLPTAAVDLVESSARKAEGIARLAVSAEIGNAIAIAARVEAHAVSEPAAYDLATARALASTAVVLEYAAPLLVEGGAALLWRGARDQGDEAAGAKAAAALGLEAAEVLEVTPFPGAHSRHLHRYRKVQPTPDRFPRRPGIATKRPLA